MSEIAQTSPIELDDSELLAVSGGASTATGGNGGNAGGTNFGTAFSNSNFGGVGGNGGAATAK